MPNEVKHLPSDPRSILPCGARGGSGKQSLTLAKDQYFGYKTIGVEADM